MSNQKVVLERQVEQQQKQIASLNLDLSKKARQARTLHEIIHQSAQESTDVSDEVITKRFGDLQYSILKIVNKHYSNVEARAYVKDLASLTKEDRFLTLRSKIASKIYARFFHPEQKHFGFSRDREQAQVDLEIRLVDKNGAWKLIFPSFTFANIASSPRSRRP